MCSFRLYGIIRSHPHDTEKYPCQDGGTARLNRGTALWDLTFPQRECYAQLHTTCSAPGYQRSRSTPAGAFLARRELGSRPSGTPNDRVRSEGITPLLRGIFALYRTGNFATLAVRRRLRTQLYQRF